jgi:hypothetical protein
MVRITYIGGPTALIDSEAGPSGSTPGRRWTYRHRTAACSE